MSEKKPLGLFGLAMLGFAPLTVAAGLLLLVRYYSGSWDYTFRWIVVTLFSLIGLGLVVFAALLIGQKLWFGTIDDVPEGRGGLSRIKVQRAERKAEQVRAREAAKQQDGQVSVAGDEPGRVSIAEGRS